MVRAGHDGGERELPGGVGDNRRLGQPHCAESPNPEFLENIHRRTGNRISFAILNHAVD
jgi:hypothetical protein